MRHHQAAQAAERGLVIPRDVQPGPLDQVSATDPVPGQPSATGYAGCRAGKRQVHRQWGCQVTTSERQARPVQVGTPPSYRKGSLLADWLSTTDYKVIGHLFLTTSFGFFLIGGIMAMVMRAQLVGPNNHRSRGSAPSAPRSTCSTGTSQSGRPRVRVASGSTSPVG